MMLFRCISAAFLSLALVTCTSPSQTAGDTLLFDSKNPAAAADWSAAKLPEATTEAPAPKVEILPAGSLKLTFDGGDWPAVATTRIPVPDWFPYETLRATLTVERPLVAYFRILQGNSDDKGKQPFWERTIMLQKGNNDIVLPLRIGMSSQVLQSSNGDITSLIIGAFRPEKNQTLTIANLRLSATRPPPHDHGWYSPYNHDGYSAAVAADYARTGKLTRFQVAGTDLDVADVKELARRLPDKSAMPPAKTLEQVESEFKATFETLKQKHPRAVLAVLREGDKGFDPANPEKPYAGWTFSHITCHGPDGPNSSREKTPRKYEIVEVFMRHRSPLMKADLSIIPRNATILAARLVVTRVQAPDLKDPTKPNMWVAEPCNRPWDQNNVNCYSYAPGKLWKAVSGLYYADDPDFHPVFLAHGPVGAGTIYDWDFTHALKFWTDGKHENHGFLLYGDSRFFMMIHTPLCRQIPRRPAIFVIYEPRE